MELFWWKKLIDIFGFADHNKIKFGLDYNRFSKPDFKKVVFLMKF